MKKLGNSVSIFVKNLTTLDVATLSKNKGLQGHSFNLSVEISGKKSRDGMLIDFKDLKSVIKKKIDKDIDHRIFATKSDGVSLGSHFSICKKINKDSHIILHLPKKNFFFIDNKTLTSTNKKTFCELSEKISTLLKKQFQNKLQIKISLEESHKDANAFNYLHCLSFHEGHCKKLHGHGSTIRVYGKKGELLGPLSKKVSRMLHNKTIVSKGLLKKGNDLKKILNIINLKEIPSYRELSSQNVTIFYTNPKGVDYLFSLPKKEAVLLGDESTIENISEHIFKLLSQTETLDIHKIVLHEGTQKGAIVRKCL